MSESENLHETIKYRAYLLSKENKSRDQLNWLLAESELRLQLGTQYSSDMIKSLASSIAKQNISLQMLHWLIAEKQTLYDQKNKKLR
jgi:hypothetical protein